MRVFIALPLSPETREGVSEAVESFKRRYCNELTEGSWVKKDNLHITLLFLGEVAEDEAGAYIKSVSNALAGQKKFKLSFGGYSAFPSIKNVKVLYSFLKDGAESCRRLHEKISAALPARFSEGAVFRSHLTIARFHRKKPVLPAEAWRQKMTLYFTADKCVFYRSVLSRKGAEYTELAAIPFNGERE